MNIEINGILDGLTLTQASGWVSIEKYCVSEEKPLITITLGGDVIAQGFASMSRIDINSLDKEYFGFSLKFTNNIIISQIKNISELIVYADYKSYRKELGIYEPLELVLRFFILNSNQRDNYQRIFNNLSSSIEYELIPDLKEPQNYFGNKFNVVIATMIKDESEYINEWISYYINLGVEHFFIYDNNSTDDLYKVLSSYINAGLVTLFFWPKSYGQWDAFNHAKFLVDGKAKFLGFFDIDEFLVLKNDENIYKFLIRLNADQVLIPWKTFGYCGNYSKPKTLVTESYLYANNNKVEHVKHFFRPESVINAGVHCSTPLNGAIVKMEDGEIVSPNHICENPKYLNAQVNHYQTKSFEEFTERVSKGEAAPFVNKIVPPFSTIDLKSNLLNFDDSALRYVNSTKEIMNFHKNLPIDPHAYGLRQINQVLYKSKNIVILNLLTAIGNFIIGYSSLKRTTDYHFFQKKFNSSYSEFIMEPFEFSSAINKGNIKVFHDNRLDILEFIDSIHFKGWSHFCPNSVSYCTPNSVNLIFSGYILIKTDVISTSGSTNLNSLIIEYKRCESYKDNIVFENTNFVNENSALIFIY